MIRLGWEIATVSSCISLMTLPGNIPLIARTKDKCRILKYRWLDPPSQPSSPRIESSSCDCTVEKQERNMSVKICDWKWTLEQTVLPAIKTCSNSSIFVCNQICKGICVNYQLHKVSRYPTIQFFLLLSPSTTAAIEALFSNHLSTRKIFFHYSGVICPRVCGNEEIQIYLFFFANLWANIIFGHQWKNLPF